MLYMQISGYVKDEETAAHILELLSENDMDKIQSDTCEDFETWLNGLDTRPVRGLNEACAEWIRGWHYGGRGDASTMNCILDELNERRSNAPQRLADAIYHSIVDYAKTPFDASVLTMDLIKGSMEELGVMPEAV